LCGVLSGCGIATFSVGIPAVSYWYPQKKQGAVLALYGGLGNLAPGIFALVLPWLVLRFGFFSSYSLWFFMILATIILFYAFMRDAPYFQYKEMGLAVDKDALLFACGEELVPGGKAMASLRKASADYRTWILTLFYFVSFGGFALPIFLGLFVDLSGPKGYPLGFSIFTALGAGCLAIFLAFLRKQEKVA
jgi:nitrate/nitrite transporter NarK